MNTTAHSQYVEVSNLDPWMNPPIVMAAILILLGVFFIGILVLRRRRK